jgi:hypothetical protein
MAVHLSSAVMNALIIGAGLYGCRHSWPPLRVRVFIAIGFAGLFVTWMLWKTHKRMIETISDYKRQPRSDAPPVE